MPDKDLIRTERQIPVMIGQGKHVMAKAEIYRTPDKILIQITGEGEQGQLLAEFLEQAEPIGLSFNPIPVRNIRETQGE